MHASLQKVIREFDFVGKIFSFHFLLNCRKEDNQNEFPAITEKVGSLMSSYLLLIEVTPSVKQVKAL